MSDEWTSGLSARTTQADDLLSTESVVNTLDCRGDRIEIGFDPSGPVGGNHYVVVTGGDYTIRRHFYFDDADAAAKRAFGRRVVEDHDFRKQSLEGTAEWCYTDDIYREAARRIRAVFDEHGLLTYRTEEDDAHRRRTDARYRMEMLCETVYEQVKREVRSDELIRGLDTFIEDQIIRAERIAEDIESERPHRDID
jgi:hypothetical protein